MAYLREAALVQGAAAHVLDKILARYLPDLLPALPAWMRAEVLAARDDLRRAGDAYIAQPASANGSAEVPEVEVGPSWTEDMISAAAAAPILGVSERWMRHLGAAGLGVKVGRTWMFDRTVVHAERQHRTSE